MLEKYLQEGVLKEEFVLDSIPKLMNTMREANVTLRWLMLHNCALTPGELLQSAFFLLLVFMWMFLFAGFGGLIPKFVNTMRETSVTLL